MSKLLLIVALLLLLATSSSIVSGDLFHDHEEVPYFFQLPNKEDAQMCCAQCVDEKTCLLYTENREDTCAGLIDYESIGLINFPGGRMITTSKRVNDKWQVLWIENATDPVLKSRDFSWKDCVWKSKVRSDDDLDPDVTELLMDAVFDPKHDHEVLVSLEEAHCDTFNCDVTFYKKHPRDSIQPSTRTVGVPISANFLQLKETQEPEQQEEMKEPKVEMKDL
ncbi:hypothetical protein TKK_0011775 [Trichogramma kaykai]|uniref:Apple domain-containing protein n=1 Tax=Trichogramma kaykai TaxID=54128 RepID=A0ABD2WPR3_9HYME